MDGSWIGVCKKPKHALWKSMACEKFAHLHWRTRIQIPNPNGYIVPCRTCSLWSCRSVYIRQDVYVAKIVLCILSSCTYWWENRYPYPPSLHDGTPLPIVGWDPPPHIWLMTPLPILGWWPPYPYLADDPPPTPHGWMMWWVKLVLVVHVSMQDHRTDFLSLHRVILGTYSLFLYITGIRAQVRLRQCKWTITVWNTVCVPNLFKMMYIPSFQVYF